MDAGEGAKKRIFDEVGSNLVMSATIDDKINRQNDVCSCPRPTLAIISVYVLTAEAQS